MFVVFFERRTQIRMAVAFLFLLAVVSVRVGTITSYHAVQARGGLVPIRSVKTSQEQIALSFDLNEGQHTLIEVLDVLQSEDVRATFFVNGAWAESHPDLVQRMHQAGHEVANGGYSADKHPALGPQGVAESIGQAHRSLEEALAEEPTALFRPPGGYSNSMVVNAALDEGYHTVLWRLDSRDSVTTHAQRTIKWVTHRARAGDIIRFSANDAGHQATPILIGVIAALREHGITLMTVGDLIRNAKD